MKIFQNIKISFLVLVVLFGFVSIFASITNAQTPPPAPTVTLSANPQSISGYQGLSTNLTLTWSSTGANFCSSQHGVPSGGGAIHLFPLDQNWPSDWQDGTHMNGPTSGSASFLFSNSSTAVDIPFDITCYAAALGSTPVGTTANIIIKYTPLSTNPVTITSPSAGSSWQIGTAQTISWTFPDAFSADTTSVAKISLVGSDGKSYIIAQSAPNTGSYGWDGTVYQYSGTATTSIALTKTTIPADSYSMQILVSGSHTGTVSGKVSFNLSGSSPGTDAGPSATTPTITVIAPTSGSSWASGSTQTIRWSNTGIPSGAKGWIFLTKSDSMNFAVSTNYSIVNNVLNTGSYVWSGVGNVYAIDKTIHTSYYDQCTQTSPPPSCYDKVTSLPAGSYTMNIWFNADSSDVPVNSGKVRTISSPGVTFNIGVAGSVSTPPATINENPSSSTPPVTPAPGCSGSNIYNPQTGQLCSASSTPVVGCRPGNIYNTQTGLPCASNAGTSQTPSAGSYDFGTITLKKGSTGDAVKELQRFLNDDLNLGLTVDGKLGPKTISVIIQWQSNNGLTADGLVGIKTKAEMMRRIPRGKQNL